ncbi:MAG: hypothetical protein ABIJ00_07230 [Candidatus Eisenbacteria bacterium]
MKPTEQRIHLIAHCTNLRGTTNPTDLRQDSCPAISELPLSVQPEASKFLRLIDKVIGRLNSVVTGLCDGYLEELQLCPHEYERLAAYHVDLLARRIGKEVDALYQALRVSTIEHIEMWYERQSPKTSREEHQETTSAC